MNETYEKTQLLQVECTADKDTAVRLFIVAGLLIGVGIYCLYDDIIGKFPYKPFEEDINAWATWALNHFGPYVFFPLALILIALAIRSATRRLIADEDGIGYAGKARIPWSRIIALDASVLQSKQILTLHHGQDKKLTLDGYKLKNFRDLVAFIEERVPESPKPKAAAAAPKQDQ